MAESVKKLVEGFKDFDFEQHYKTERDPRMKTRLLALHHLSHGMSLKDTSAVTLSHENSIRSWVRAFAKDGLDGLEEKPGLWSQAQTASVFRAGVRGRR